MNKGWSCRQYVIENCRTGSVLSFLHSFYEPPHKRVFLSSQLNITIIEVSIIEVPSTFEVPSTHPLTSTRFASAHLSCQ